MHQEMVKQYAFSLYSFYVELIYANQGYVHDPEAHNLCSAVCEFHDGTVAEYLSYSNPSGLPINVRKYLLGSLIPSGTVHGAIIDRGGMQDLHTEVRLLNYLAAQGVLDRGGMVSFFSTRSVCPTCAQAIGQAQVRYARSTAFIPFELRAESLSAGEMQNVWIYVAQRETGGAVRHGDPSVQGSFGFGA